MLNCVKKRIKAFLELVDTRVRDSSGKYFNIEIQSRRQRSFIKRFAYYTAKMFSNQLDYGDKYENLHYTIGVALLGFDLFPNSKEIDETFSFKNKNSDIILKDIIEMHFISLAKSPHTDDLKNMTSFDMLAYFKQDESIHPQGLLNKSIISLRESILLHFSHLLLLGSVSSLYFISKAFFAFSRSAI